MARKKSKGSKKSRSKKSRAKKPRAKTSADSAPESRSDADAVAEVKAPADPTPALPAAGDASTEEDRDGTASSEGSSDGKTARKKRARSDKTGQQKRARSGKAGGKARRGRKAASDNESDGAGVDAGAGVEVEGEAGAEADTEAAAEADAGASVGAENQADADVPEDAEAESAVGIEAEIIDVDEEEDVADLIAGASEDERPVPVDLDEEVADAGARERLIAEALAFVEAEETAEPPTAEGPGTGHRSASGVDDADGTDGQIPGAASPDEGEGSDTGDGAEPSGTDERASDSPAQAGADGTGEAAHAAGQDEAEGEAAAARDDLVIGAEALLALSEIRAEGLASVPDELVLDLGEASTPEERDRLMAAALAHAEMQEAIYRVPAEERRSRRIKAAIAASILLVAATVGLRPPGFLVPAPPPALTDADIDHGIRVALLLQAEQVEAFRAANGRLPRSIAEVETRLPGIRMVSSSSRLYQLVVYAPGGDEPVVFDSEAPEPEFERMRRALGLLREPR